MRNKQKMLWLFLFVPFLLGTVTLDAQTVSKTFRHETLKNVLKEVERQTGLSVIYKVDEVNVNKSITATFKKTSVQEVLSRVLDKDLEYQIRNKTIIIHKRKVVEKIDREIYKIHESGSKGASEVLKGIVISSADNQPLIGVSIHVPGSSAGTITDVHGRYSLNVPAGTKTVQFKYIGFYPKELNVADKYLFQLVTMVEEVHQLNEAVVIGFGSKEKKESVVGAITSVKPSDLALTSSNLTTAFAGNIPGVIASQSSGEPGYDSPSFYIRGISTFGANNQALLILDGVEITGDMLGQIAPETIESFSILKDATATALYGSRGANGVIIITTKSGHESEKMNVKLRFDTSVSMPTIIQKIANGITYMKSYNEAVKNSDADNGIEYTPFFSDAQIEGTSKHLNPYVFPNNDWYHMLFRNYSVNRDLNLNVTGGSRYLDYFLNAAIFDEDGIVKQPSDSPYNVGIDFKKFLFQSNVSANITKTTRVSLKMNTQLMYNHRPYVDLGSLFYESMRANPVMFPATFPAQEGDTYVRYGNNDELDNEVNPYAQLSEGYGTRYYSYLTSVFSVDQKLNFITKGLSCNVLASFYNYTFSSNYRHFTPFYYKLLDYTANTDGTYNYETQQFGAPGSTYLNYTVGTGGNHQYSFQGKMEYSRLFSNKHDVNAMIVYHMKENDLNTPSSSENDILPFREQGLAGRFTYNYDKRYFVEYDCGYNGSENFAKGHRWGFFPSYAIGYMISNESFFKPLKAIVNTLKLRASYGLAGNDYLSTRFPYITTVSMSNGLPGVMTGVNFSQQYGPLISFYGNENATWEKSKKFNVGIDLQLLNDFSFTCDFFEEKRSGIFMQRASLPSSIGLSGTTPWANVGKVNNHGVDLSANYNHVVNKNFFYTVRSTFTYARNIVKNIDEPPILQYNYTSKVGHPINTFYGLIADGLFTSKQEVENSPKQQFGNYGVGDIKYRDLNGDGVIDNNDITAIGKPSVPQIIYGFGGSLKYHRIDFSVMFQGAASVDLQMYNMHPFNDLTYIGYNIMQYIVDNHYSDSNPDPHAAYPRLTSIFNNNNVQGSTYWIKKADYLRLKSIEVGYSFHSFRFSLSGFNLFYISSFKHWDPEVGSGNGLSYPLQRSVKLGIQYEF